MPAPREATRRRSPAWVRAMTSRELHGVAGHLNAERLSADLSDRQEWLWDAVVSELEYRRRRATWPVRSCTCYLCLGPFPYEELLED